MLPASLFSGNVEPSSKNPEPSDAMAQAQTLPQGPSALFSSGAQRVPDGTGASTDSALASVRSAFAQPSMQSQFNPLLSPFSPGYQMPLHPLLSRTNASGLVPPSLSSSLLPTDIAALLSHLHPPPPAQPQPTQTNPQQQPQSVQQQTLSSHLLSRFPPAPAPSDSSAAAVSSAAPSGLSLPDARISLTAQDLMFLLDLFARGVYPGQQAGPSIANPLATSSLWPGAATPLPPAIPSALPATIAQLDTSQPLFPLPMTTAAAASSSSTDPFSRANGQSKKRHAEPEPLIAPEIKHRVLPGDSLATDEKDGKHLPKIRCSFPSCTKSFTKMTNLRRHQRLHNGHKPFTCPWTSGVGTEGPCGKRFARRADLRAHERTHTGEKPYQCSVCSRTFARNSDWRSHERTHQKIKPFTCDVPQCGRSFARRTDIKKHFKTHPELSDAEITSKIQHLSAHRSSSADSEHQHDSDSPPPTPPPPTEKAPCASKKRKGNGASEAAEAKIKTTMTSEQAESWWDMLPNAASASSATASSSQ